jgi:hypothetical protein
MLIYGQLLHLHICSLNFYILLLIEITGTLLFMNKFLIIKNVTLTNSILFISDFILLFHFVFKGINKYTTYSKWYIGHAGFIYWRENVVNRHRFSKI